MNTTATRGTGGGAATVSRGAAAGGARSYGGGIESRGGIGARSSFGNTSRFESSFSGRSLATKPSTEGRKAPMITIGKDGTFAQKSLGKEKTSSFGQKLDTTKGISSRSTEAFGANLSGAKAIAENRAKQALTTAPKYTISKTGAIEAAKTITTDRQNAKKEPTLRSTYGPKIEGIKGYSVDNQKPAKEAFKGTTTLYSRAKESAPTPHSSEKAVVTPEAKKSNLLNQTKELQVQRNAFSPDSARSKDALNNTTTLYARNPKGEQPMMQPITHIETRSPRIAPFEPSRFSPVFKSFQGERNIGSDTLRRTNEPTRALYERTKPTIKPATEGMVISRTGEISKQKLDTSATWRQALETKTAPRAVTQVQKEPARAATSSTERTKQFNQMLKTSKVLEVSPALRPAEQVKQAVLPQTRERVSPAIVTPAVEQQVTKIATQPATKTETQTLLAAYQQTYLKVAQTTVRPETMLATHPEVKADLEQATRVMRAYAAVQESQGIKVGMAESQQVVLRALDQKLAKTQLKTQLLTGTQPQHMVETIISPSVQVEAQTQPKTAVTTVPVNETHVLPLPLPETKVKTEESVEPITALDLSTVMQPETQKISKQSMQNMTYAEMITMMDDPEITQQERFILEQHAVYTITCVLEIIYERDRKIDDLRIIIIRSVAKRAFLRSEGRPVSGEIIAAEISGPLYDLLTSVIAPVDGPDDYLSDILDAIASQDFVSMDQVEDTVHSLVMQKPAIKLGDIQDVSQQDVEIVQRSTRYPIFSA